MKRVLIMRGIPGSGKTTEANRWASMVPDAVTVSADHYMFADGQDFEFDRLLKCHELCMQDYSAALKHAPLVIVDNTNTKFSDIIYYVQQAERFGYDFTILQVHCSPKVAFKRGLHNVPLEALKAMAARIWSERLPTTWDVWNKGQPWKPQLGEKMLDEVKNAVEVLRKRVPA